MKKWQTGIIYSAMIIIFFIYKADILHWMQTSHAPVSFAFLIALCFVMIPVIPYKIVIGTLGFMYGPLLGAFISWSAASTASVIMFLLVRHYFQKQAGMYISKFDRLEKLQKTMEKHPFLTILMARLIPVIPQVLVNIYPAISSIRLLTYVWASVLGKIPGILLFSFIGKSLFSDLPSLLITIGVYAVFLIMTYAIYRLWLKDRLV
jgi:uncharacterized membrane protein YdjX (TVP38/TMEM64 family)